MKKPTPKRVNNNPLIMFWNFLWKDDSIWSTIVLVIISFILIKYLFLPFVGLILGTKYPIVAVVSGSMDHALDMSRGQYGEICGETRKEVLESYSTDLEDWWGVCGGWYTNKGITKEGFDEFPIRNGFKRGDIIILRGKEPENINIGDIIVFRSSNKDPIIHRVVIIDREGENRYFQTKGDHNADINSGIQEERIEPSRIIGVALLRVPWLGYVKIKAVEFYDSIRR